MTYAVAPVAPRADAPAFAGLKIYSVTGDGTSLTISGVNNSGYTLQLASSDLLAYDPTNNTDQFDPSVTFADQYANGSITVGTLSPAGNVWAAGDSSGHHGWLSSWSYSDRPLVLPQNGQSVTVSGSSLQQGNKALWLNFDAGSANSLSFLVVPDTSDPTPIPLPAVTSVFNSSGPTGGTYTVTITGSRFTGTTSVLFGDVPASSFTVTSDTSIVATVPSQPLGTVDVTVTTPEGQSMLSSADQFTYINGQWASSVVGFSSQYSDTYWAATQALGSPNTLDYGDIPTAWAPREENGRLEWINLGFTTPVYANGVTIRETNGNGFVYQVDLVDTSGGLHTIWTGTDPSQPGTPVDFVINFATTSYLAKGVKIYVDTNHDLSTWEEIDAVLLAGGTSGGGSAPQQAGASSVTATRASSIQQPNAGPFATFSSSSQQISLGGSVTFAFSNQHDRSGAAAGASAFTYSFDFNNDGKFTDPGDLKDSTSPSAVFRPTKRGWNVVHGRITDASGHFTDFWAKVFVV
jgi:hypothetical protein